ncbi:MAG: hypothetical protein HYU41_13900 [Candidatus Rokubacteria bacterium]|nr:hypothetical protein [Candidatus Rokubacteria bacterium]
MPAVSLVTIGDALLRGEIAPVPDGARLTLDRRFGGLPDMAHGGTILALFDALAAHRGPRRIRGHYIRRVPLATDLTLTHAMTDGATRLVLADTAGTTLVDGTVTAVSERAEARASSGGERHPLPVSSTCFVCGIENELGLRATLEFDDQRVRGQWQPREAFRAADGTLAPVALTALLDEGAFWLGALATGESGMTTEIEVTLRQPAAYGAPITIVGDRARVTPRAGDARYLDTELAAYTDDGTPVATGRITFVSVRGASRRMTKWLARTNAPETIERVFRT